MRNMYVLLSVWSFTSALSHALDSYGNICVADECTLTKSNQKHITQIE